MKQSSKITDLDSRKYLSEQIKKVTLPKNAIFDKGKVGCGGTTLALESEFPYVICVPFVSLIENKVEQVKSNPDKEEVYGFYGDNNKKRDLMEYLKRVSCPKIMVTYDSLGKLTNWIDPSKFKILIDELHLLFTEYSYRYEAVQSVLNNYTKYNEFCFMTATPLDEEFELEELKDIPLVEAVWDNVTTVKVQSVRCKNKVKDTVAQLIMKFKNGKYKENAYFFVNSVGYITDLVKICDLDDTNTRAIYSKNNKTDVGLKRGSTLDQPKKINFITSTAFEGCDIYDEDGLTFIISDSSETQTMIDISTKFQQIAGRIRNSKYANVIYHIFKETRYSSLSYDDFKEFTDKTISETKEMISDISGKSYADKISTNELYVRKEGKNFIFDPNRVKIDLYNFKICRNIYSLRANLNAEYKKYNFEVDSFDFISEEVRNINVMAQSFKEIVEELKEEEQEIYRLDRPVRDLAFKKYPFLEEAINKIGFKGIEELKYNITNIKIKLIGKLDKSEDNKVMLSLKGSPLLKVGEFIESSKVKALFQKIYRELGITKVAKGTDILNYYDVKDNKEMTKKIDGKATKGYLIYRMKVVFN